MKDFITKNEGNSRFLKSVSNFLTLYPNYEDFAQALVDGTLPIDFNGYNDDGITQRGTPYSKAAVLSDATAAKLGLNSSSNPTPNDAFAALANGSRYVAINGRAFSGEAIAASENGVGAIAIGPNAAAIYERSIAIGENANSDWLGIAIGLNACSPTGSIVIGTNPNVTKSGGIAIGESASVNASYGIAIGMQANAEGETSFSTDVNEKNGNSIAIGPYAVTRGGASVAIGGNAATTGYHGVAIGHNVKATGNASIAIGNTADGYSTTAIGSYVTGDSTVGIGGAPVTGNQTIGISTYASIEGNNSVGIGGGVQDNSVAVGFDSFANVNSVAIGANARAYNTSSVVIGCNACVGSQSAIVIGTNIGYYGVGNGSIHIGMNYSGGEAGRGEKTISIGDDSIASTNGVAIGAGAFARQNAVAIGLNSFSSGEAAIGQNSHSVSSSIAIGQDSLANALYTIAFGPDTRATVNGGVAIGNNAIASGRAAIAIGAQPFSGSSAGDSTTAQGESSVAIGRSASSLGEYGTAAGGMAQATGNYAAAIGSYSTVTGERSTALGYGASTSASNTIQLGDNINLSTLTCKVSLTTSSDERDKTDIAPISGGATRFLRSIQAIRYVWNGRALYQEEETFTEETYTDEDGNEQTRRVSSLSEAEREKRGKFGLGTYDKEAHERGDKKGERVRVGVSAQQVQQALETVYGDSSYANLVNDNLHDFDPAGIPDDVESQLTVNYEGFVPFLIQAVKELDERVSALEK